MDQIKVAYVISFEFCHANLTSASCCFIYVGYVLCPI